MCGKTYRVKILLSLLQTTSQNVFLSLEFAGMVADTSSSKTLLVDAPVELTVLVTKHESKLAMCMHIDLVLTCFPFSEWPRQSLPVHMNPLETFFRTWQ